MRIRLIGAIALLVAVLGRASARTQAPVYPALETYRLTMPNIRKMAAAYERLDAALTAKPSLVTNFANAKGATSPDDLIARFENEPIIRKASAWAGLTTRDLVLTQLATFTTGMTSNALRAGAKPPTAPAAAANLRLYQQNRPEIERITARLRTLASWRAIQPDEAADDDDDG